MLPPRFINCDCSGFLAFVVRVRSRWHKSSYLKIVQRLCPNPNQLVSSDGKANSKKCSHRESCNSKSDDICNFHALSMHPADLSEKSYILLALIVCGDKLLLQDGTA